MTFDKASYIGAGIWFCELALVAALFLTSCTTPTSPEPCTKQEIHHGDTVTVPCVMHGGIGDSVGVLLD